jgi:hypothetical protein
MFEVGWNLNRNTMYETCRRRALSQEIGVYALTWEVYNKETALSLAGCRLLVILGELF